VYGVTRSADKAVELAKEEIFPVVGELENLDSWTPTAEACTVVIDCTAFNNELALKILHAMEKIGAKKPMVFVYTSGIWTTGKSSHQMRDERSYSPDVSPLVVERPETVKRILHSKHLTSIVISPGLVYGKAGSLFGMWFGAALKGNLEVPMKLENRNATVHVDDLAEAYVRAVERADWVKGHEFIVTNPSSESAYDIMTAIKRVTGYKGEIKCREPTSPFEVCLGLNMNFSSKKAKTLLGWHPHHPSFADGAASYLVSFKAYNGIN